jgi:hypothetical protein
MAVSAKVLDTYELLEDVLLHLPLIDLLHVWKVNQNFRDVVWNSCRINKAHFISYTTDKIAEWEEEGEDEFTSMWVQPEGGLVPVIILNPFLELLVFRFSDQTPKAHYLQNVT